MITLGIDLSSMPAGTAACLIVWSKECAVAEPPVTQAGDDTLDALIARSHAVGIDAPLGWPAAFSVAAGEWPYDRWDTDLRDRLSYRTTDFVVRRLTRKWPLSVSSDRIALPAMRAMALLKRHAVSDKSGDGRFYEVYPSGSLAMWRVSAKGYKRERELGLADRRRILSELTTAMPWLRVPGGYAVSDDALDALLASLSVRAAVQGLAVAPGAEEIEAARREGWIHLPTELPRL